MPDGSVTIVIPVKNGLPRFREVCDALAMQEFDADWDVLCIDSGSTDGSQEIANSKGFRVHEIKPETFGHGRTRNLGVELSDSEFIAFLTHDAVPVNRHWLSNLIAPLRRDPKVAGVFSRHIAHRDADPFVAWELAQHFDRQAQFPIVEINDWSAYESNEALRQVFHFYSDNASAMRRSVWDRYPYPDVQFAEDQIWAKTIIEAGYRKAYAADSIVQHSHSFGAIETLQRNFDEARAFQKLFGYRLSPSLKSAVGSAIYLAKRDLRLAVERGWWRSHPAKTVSRLGEAVARPLGHYFAGRNALPAWLERKLSRDAWIRTLGAKEYEQNMNTLLLKSAKRYHSANGTRATLRAIKRKISLGGQVSTGPVHTQGKVSQKIDIIGPCRKILAAEHGSLEQLERANPDVRTLQWVVPNFGYGSGGHLNIFRFINHLADMGYQQRMVILPPHDWKSPVQATELIEKWYHPLKAEVALGINAFEPSHATIATGWQTAYWVEKFQSTREKFYFVQDFEPAFYANSSDYHLAENTYRLGLKGITAGPWLSKKLHEDYGMKTGAVSFGCDTDFYRPKPRRKSRNFNILFYSRHVTKRRLFELGVCALDGACKECPEVAVIFAGGDVSGFKIPFHHLNAGQLSLGELPDLYSQCDLSLVLSGTNLSLLPLELAACKCPVVMNDAPSSRWLLSDEEAYYAPPCPEMMAKVLINAVKDTKGRRSRAEKAFALSQRSSWKEQAKKMSDYLRAL